MKKFLLKCCNNLDNFHKRILRISKLNAYRNNKRKINGSLAFIYIIILLICIKTQVASNVLFPVMTFITSGICIMQLLDSLESAGKLIWYLFLDTITTPVCFLWLFYVIDLAFNPLTIGLMVGIWSVLWGLVSLLAEPKAAQIANNFYTTMSTVIITICSVISMVVSGTEEMYYLSQSTIIVSIFCLPFLSLSMLSTF